MAIPKKDSLLVPYVNNFSTRITASPTLYGLTSAQASEFYSRKQAYITAYDAMMTARADGTRSAAQTTLKNTRKKAVLEYGRELYALVQANQTVSDADKTLLGVHVRDTTPTPIPPPSVRPGMDLVSVVGRTVTIHIHDSASSAKRGKPTGAISAFVYSFVGENYPSDPTHWQFQGPATKAHFEFTLPGSVPNGSLVWICAAWVNRRGEAGPPSVPISTNIQGGGASVSGDLKIAA